MSSWAPWLATSLPASTRVSACQLVWCESALVCVCVVRLCSDGRAQVEVQRAHHSLLRARVLP